MLAHVQMICIKLPYFKCASKKKKEAKGANYLDDDGRSLLDNNDNDAPKHRQSLALGKMIHSYLLFSKG